MRGRACIAAAAVTTSDIKHASQGAGDTQAGSGNGDDDAWGVWVHIGLGVTLEGGAGHVPKTKQGTYCN
jgi:hypothetical protein